MALADFDALRAVIATPDQVLRQVKTAAAGVGKSTKFTCLWEKGLENTGATPSTAAATDNTTAGAMTKVDAGAGRQIIVGGQQRAPTNTGNTAGGYGSSRTLLIIDRLSHQGGLVGNLNTSQTTNLPTAALPRYTSGVGVMIGINTYAALGSTASQLDVTYTNSGGTGSRVGSLVLGTSEYTSVDIFNVVPLQAGDLGAKSVESVQLTVSTGTAGNWGIVLFKPLGFVVTEPDGSFDILSNAMWSEEVLDSACLQVVTFGVTGATFLTQTLSLAEC